MASDTDREVLRKQEDTTNDNRVGFCSKSQISNILVYSQLLNMYYLALESFHTCILSHAKKNNNNNDKTKGKLIGFMDMFLKRSDDIRDFISKESQEHIESLKTLVVGSSCK
jgi:hypothetical protein